MLCVHTADKLTATEIRLIRPVGRKIYTTLHILLKRFKLGVFKAHSGKQGICFDLSTANKLPSASSLDTLGCELAVLFLTDIVIKVMHPNAIVALLTQLERNSMLCISLAQLTMAEIS